MSDATGSVCFDRAADFYDRTRGEPAEVAAAETAQLRDALRASRRCVEIGVGTGRIAVPLAAAGQQIVGVDLSPAMLARLRAKSGARLPVVCADALRLPFATGSFDAALAAHVFHLVSDWRAVLAELRRVLRPGGLLLATRGGTGTGLLGEIRARLQEAAGWSDPPGRLDDFAELEAHLVAQGVSVDLLPAIPTPRTVTADEHLRGVEENLYSWSWGLADATRLAAAREVRDWVTQTYGDPASVEIAAPPLQWRCYRFP